MKFFQKTYDGNIVTSFPNYNKVFKIFQNESDEERDDCKNINKVHLVKDESDLSWTEEESNKVFYGKEGGTNVVNSSDDSSNRFILLFTSLWITLSVVPYM